MKNSKYIIIVMLAVLVVTGVVGAIMLNNKLPKDTTNDKQLPPTNQLTVEQEMALEQLEEFDGEMRYTQAKNVLGQDIAKWSEGFIKSNFGVTKTNAGYNVVGIVTEFNVGKTCLNLGLYVFCFNVSRVGKITVIKHDRDCINTKCDLTSEDVLKLKTGDMVGVVFARLESNGQPSLVVIRKYI